MCASPQIENTVFGLKLEMVWDFIFRVLENLPREWKVRTDLLLPSVLMATGNVDSTSIMEEDSQSKCGACYHQLSVFYCVKIHIKVAI